MVPGPITSAASAGCHATLREEPVMCVTSVAEVMQLAFEADGVLDVPSALEPSDAGEQTAEPSVDSLSLRVIDALRPRRGQSVDQVAREVGESAARIRSALGVLDLEGRVILGVDGLWRRAGGAGAVSTPARES